MFRQLRVQIIHPCRAQCAWCSTHRKNPLFQALSDSGEAERYHDTYLEVIRHFEPEELFISGGEPLAYPGLASFLRAAAEVVRTIHVFTSYQFAPGVMERFGNQSLPTAQLVLNHTPIYFEPRRWHALTRGFPFDVYLENIKRAVTLPVRKRFKLILNHERCVEEIRRFRELVEPDESCEISLKLMNDQGDGLLQDTLERTAQRVHGRLGDLDQVLAEAGWENGPRPRSSVDMVKEVLQTGDVERCVYRREPLELRLALKRSAAGAQILRYRYCPFFPPEAGHNLHLGRDPISKLAKNYHKGPFREHCHRCRLLNYRGGVPVAEPRA